LGNWRIGKLGNGNWEIGKLGADHGITGLAQ
jgi:hypothetical protein